MLKILRRLTESPSSLSRIVTNSGWLFLDRAIRMGLGVVLGIWIARYLGPERYGSLNFVLALVALVGSIGSLGMDSIIVRDLLASEADREEILGSSFGLQLIAGFVSYATAIILIAFLRPHSTEMMLMTWILGFSLAIRAWSVVKYWFESQIYSKHIVILENSIFLIFAIVKILTMIFDLGMVVLVWTMFLENIATTVGYFFLYKANHGRLSIWSGRWYRIRSILKDCWPLFLSNMAVLLYMRTDQLMIGQMIDDKAVGIYSSAVKISEVWYFIPMILVSSVYPSIIRSRETDQEEYKDKLKFLHTILLYISLSIAVLLSFVSNHLMEFVYGGSFAAAGPILSVHIWSGVFVFWGIASSRWFVLENLQRFQLYQTATGCAANLALNYFLIPRAGIMGAAVSTLISQGIASTFLNLLHKDSRFAFRMQMESFLFWRNRTWRALLR
ncbi:flippase [Leptospira fluminis]|uniref:Flippase n=1 Tax=Leptospira fluminis TaxID=2484979 RepID=A0A4R9GM84_9LEPT|nr:flippase [Leptospira fluminis]TGK17290.1 flippase [Leptospira fluminis]